jgi:hypothetical protein
MVRSSLLPIAMTRHFNTAGPCKPELHYMLSPFDRIPEVRGLVEQQAYFVIHAPRQIGKTTAMMAMADALTASGQYVAVLVTVEEADVFPDDIGAAEAAILRSWFENAQDRLPEELAPRSIWGRVEAGQNVRSALRAWAKTAERPLVLFVDEIDTLQDQVLVSVLRQLRSGYANRPRNFPSSVALIGMRDVHDYKVASGGSERLNTASPFNIKMRSLTLRSFQLDEVAKLYGQHTEETGQAFHPDAVAVAFELTQGQPWLVNALAKVVVEELLGDRSCMVLPEHIQQAKEVLIRRQDTHLHSLFDRLRETRVRRIIAPLLSGESLDEAVLGDDIQFVIDLGLCRLTADDGLVIANPIYREILPRVLSFNTIAALPVVSPIWLTSGGRLDPDALLEAFLGFWRQHGQPLLKGVAYHEIAPHIVMMAFLHRVANGGGTIEREYAIGSRRMDICLRYGETTIGMELKVWRDGEKDPLAQGLMQLDGYLAGLGLDGGWMVIFDQRKGLVAIEERTTVERVGSPGGREIMVIRG